VVFDSTLVCGKDDWKVISMARGEEINIPLRARNKAYNSSCGPGIDFSQPILSSQ